MSSSDVVQTIAQFGSILITPVALVVFQFFANSKLERIKTSLQTSLASGAKANAEDLERLRKSLQVVGGLEQQLKGRLLEKQLLAVEVTFVDLTKLSMAMAAYVNAAEFAGGPSKDQRLIAVLDGHAAFYDHFLLNQLYLPEHIAASVTEFQRCLATTRSRFQHVVHLERSTPERAQEEWLKADEFMSDEAPKLLRGLEKQFRNLIGHEPSL